MAKRKKTGRSPEERAAYLAARADLATGEWSHAPAIDKHGRACLRLLWNGTPTEKYCYSTGKADELVLKYSTPPKAAGKKAAGKKATGKKATGKKAASKSARANPWGRSTVSFRTRSGQLVRF